MLGVLELGIQPVKFRHQSADLCHRAASFQHPVQIPLQRRLQLGDADRTRRLMAAHWQARHSS